MNKSSNSISLSAYLAASEFAFKKSILEQLRRSADGLVLAGDAENENYKGSAKVLQHFSQSAPGRETDPIGK